MGKLNCQKYFVMRKIMSFVLLSFISCTSLFAQKINDGTSCFIKGTMITLSDGTTKAIEHIRKGDKILSMNLDKWATEVSTILEVDSPFHHKMVEISFWGEDSIINRNTFDHPYYVVGKGWCSYKPAETKLKYGIDAQQLSVGDICFEYFLGHLLEIRVKSIKEIVNYQRTYNLLKLSNGNNYFANNILVNNEAESPIDTLVKQKEIGKLKINDLFGEWRAKELKILVLPNVLSKTEKRNISKKYKVCRNSIFMIGRNGIISEKSESCEFSNCSEILGNLLTVKRLPIIGSSQERYDASSDITDTNIVWRPFVKLIDKNYDYSTIDAIQTNPTGKSLLKKLGKDRGLGYICGDGGEGSAV
ncbi:MAG: hypothetical protein EPN39_04725 [Chitinophagaceae bacterium]|nr:MAG: hypothetical protein EPN39_04725 [Chitinophagaceae bacterium]